MDFLVIAAAGKALQGQYDPWGYWVHNHGGTMVHAHPTQQGFFGGMFGIIANHFHPEAVNRISDTSRHVLSKHKKRWDTGTRVTALGVSMLVETDFYSPPPSRTPHGYVFIPEGWLVRVGVRPGLPRS